VLRIILGTVITFALSAVILFLILFFVFSRYVERGQLIIPWLPEFQGPVVEEQLDDPLHDPEDSLDDEEIPDTEPVPPEDE